MKRFAVAQSNWVHVRVAGFTTLWLGLETENSARRKFSRCAENSLGAPKVYRKASHSLGARKILSEREKLSAHKKKCLAALWEGLRRKRAKEPKIYRRAKTSLGPRRATKSLGVRKSHPVPEKFSRRAVLWVRGKFSWQAERSLGLWKIPRANPKASVSRSRLFCQTERRPVSFPRAATDLVSWVLRTGRFL